MTGSSLRSFTTDEARRIGAQIGVVWLQSAFDVEVETVHPPHDGRAPGWRAGLVVAHR